MLLNVSLLTECSAQRATVSLGSKIKNVLKGKSRNRRGGYPSSQDSGKFEKKEPESDNDLKSKLSAILFTSLIGALSVLLIHNKKVDGKFLHL